jgi:hypothetical protein
MDWVLVRVMLAAVGATVALGKRALRTALARRRQEAAHQGAIAEPGASEPSDRLEALIDASPLPIAELASGTGPPSRRSAGDAPR